MTNKWQGELGSSVDNRRFRKDAFDAWLAWEFLQRGVAGKTTEMKPTEMAELCGKAKGRARVMVHDAIKSPTRTRYV